MDLQRNGRKESKKGEKKCHRKLYRYIQPHGPGISFTSDYDVSGSSSSPRLETDGFSAHPVLKRKKGSTKKQEHDEDDVLGSDDDIFIKPKDKAAKTQISSSLCEPIPLTSRPPQLQSPLKRQKLRKSLSHMSPRKRFVLEPMPGSAEKIRRHTVSMTTVDMKRLQDAIDHNQRRKKNKKNENLKVQTNGSPFKIPHQKLGETELGDRAICQIEKLNNRRKRHHNSKEPEPHKRDEAMTSKQKQNGDSLNTSNHELLGKHGGKPNKDFQIFDEISNPSQELFTDTESGNETDTQAVVHRTVSRFLSSQEAQNDFRKPSCPMVDISSLSADMINPDSEVSDSSDDEANETILEKEIRSFFQSKKQQSPRSQKVVALASKVAQNYVQQGTDGGMSDESDVITAGQKVQSDESELICAGQMMESQTESEVITAGQKMQSDESEVITAGQKIQSDESEVITAGQKIQSDESKVITAGQKRPSQNEPDVMDEDTPHSSPNSPGNLEDGQRLSDDTSSTSSQELAESEIVLEQDDKGGKSHEYIVSRGETHLRTISQISGSPANPDVEIAATSDESDESMPTDIEIGGSSDASSIRFHSTPAEHTYHHESETEQEAPNAVSPSLTEVKKDKKMFELYCHKDTTPQILKALKSCGNINSRTLASASVDDGLMCIEVIRGKIFEDGADRIRAVTSPDLFEDNSDGIDRDMEVEDTKQLTQKTRQDSAKRNRKDAAKAKPNKSKKKRKKKKVTVTPGNTTVTSRPTVISGPIKGDARKKNEYRWRREMREQSKCPWSEITVEPSPESDISMLRCLKAAARAALDQRKTHQDRDAGLVEDDPDLGNFVNLVSFPDVFMTKKKDQASFRKVPPSEIQVLNSS